MQKDQCSVGIRSQEFLLVSSWLFVSSQKRTFDELVNKGPLAHNGTLIQLTLHKSAKEACEYV